jgi:hypothetical protein
MNSLNIKLNRDENGVIFLMSKKLAVVNMTVN